MYLQIQLPSRLIHLNVHLLMTCCLLLQTCVLPVQRPPHHAPLQPIQTTQTQTARPTALMNLISAQSFHRQQLAQNLPVPHLLFLACLHVAMQCMLENPKCQRAKAIVKAWSCPHTTCYSHHWILISSLIKCLMFCRKLLTTPALQRRYCRRCF